MKSPFDNTQCHCPANTLGRNILSVPLILKRECHIYIIGNMIGIFAKLQTYFCCRAVIVVHILMECATLYCLEWIGRKCATSTTMIQPISLFTEMFFLKWMMICADLFWWPSRSIGAYYNDRSALFNH